MRTVPVDLDGRWAIVDKIHGGYLLAEIVRAAIGDDAAHPDPLGVSAHFASAPDPGPATVTVEPLRTGRTVGVSRARLTQGDKLRVEVLITAGTLPTAEPVFVAPSAAPPTLAPVADCPRSDAEIGPNARLGHLDFLDLRLDPATTRWMHGEPAGQAVVRGWIRRADEGELDPYWLLIAGDAPPPVTVDLGLKGWVPTITLDAHIRSRPQPGWLMIEQSAQLVAGGWIDETCTLWDETGRLTASVRQLAAYRG